jgi:hypothetical protein
MRILNILLSILIFSSCSQENRIFYEYNGVVITRINKDNQIYFYRGKQEDSSFIKAEYSGLNSGMGAYLVFKPNGMVELVKVYDSFEKFGSDSSLVLKEYKENIEFIKWTDSIKGNYNNIIEVSDIINIEKERNLQNHSKVKVTYPH